MSSFIPFSDEEIKVGKAIKKELWKKLKDNFDNHEQRILTLSVGAAPVVAWDNTVVNASSATSLTGLDYFEAVSSFTITTVKLQIFETGITTSGILSFDVKKNNSLDPIGFQSVLTTQPSINFSSASDYDFSEGILDSSNQFVNAGDFLRLDITSLPVQTVGKFRVLVYGII
jgi:hypothetical protein